MTVTWSSLLSSGARKGDCHSKYLVIGRLLWWRFFKPGWLLGSPIAERCVWITGGCNIFEEKGWLFSAFLYYHQTILFPRKGTRSDGRRANFHQLLGKKWNYAHHIYNDLLWDGHLVWIDKRIEEGERWRPQIDHNLKAAKSCLVLISPEAIDSKWVHHEISMACGRDLDIIPIKIKDYKPKVALTRFYGHDECRDWRSNSAGLR